MYSYHVEMPCRGHEDKRNGYAAVEKAQGRVSGHKLNFVNQTLTLYVNVEPENDAIFKSVLPTLNDAATITSPSRGKLPQR